MLNVLIPSPPVPQLSIIFSSISTFEDIFLIDFAKPTNSSIQTPFLLRHNNTSIICSSLKIPSNIFSDIKNA